MANNDFPKLVILAGPEQGKEFPLTVQNQMKVGRADDNDLVLTDNSVSRHHFSLLFKEGKYFIQDAGSRNGTYLDNEKLTEQKSYKLFHLDTIQLGLYEIRFLEKEFEQKDLDEKNSQKKPVTDQKQTSQQMDSQSTKDGEESIKNENENDSSSQNEGNDSEVIESKELSVIEEAEDDDISESSFSKKLRWIFIIVAILCVLASVGYFLLQEFYKTNDNSINDKNKITHSKKNKKQKKKTKTAQSTQQNQNIKDKQQDKTNTEIEVISFEDQKTTSEVVKPKFHVFLDIKTKPLTADIFLGEKRLGKTPIKVNLPVETNKNYSLYADFDLRDLNDVYRKKINFSIKPNTDIVELIIDAEIGTLKIQKLPRRSEFYLEGFYAYDKLKSHPVKIHDVVYGKPIYLPYGKYIVELREKAKIANSDNEITAIRYQREYTIDEKNRVLELNVTDRDLQFFPAIIRSNPSNAKVFYADEEVGVTPYNGLLPIGKHKIKISKEGYFDKIIDIDMNMNAVYETTVPLQTSKMGELINKAKELIRTEKDKDAIAVLVDALKYGGSKKEKSEVYYLLGDIYLRQKSYEQAKPYFEKASYHKDFEQLSLLGLAQVYQHSKQNTEALKLIVQILTSLDADTPENVKGLANSIFKKISPLRSVMYVYTEPAGAQVYINDKKISKSSPLILSELGLGNYRIEIQKAGYKTYKTTQNLKVGEFIAIKIQLEPEQL